MDGDGVVPQQLPCDQCGGGNEDDIYCDNNDYEPEPVMVKGSSFHHDDENLGNS